MAPRGAKSQTSTSQNTRGTRSSTVKGRGATKAGVQKRRAKVDVDGDLDMGAARRTNTSTTTDPNAPRSRAAARSTNPRTASRTVQNVLKHLGNGDTKLPTRASTRNVKPRNTLSFLRIHGLKNSKAASNPDGGLQDLMSFLERKASGFTNPTGTKKRQVAIKKSKQIGDYVFIGATREDAEEIIKLNTFMFAGTPLEIVESEDGQGHHGKAIESKETQELRSKLQDILSQRYLGETKLLQLNALASDTELVTLGMFENRERALKTFKGLMAICDGLFKTLKEKRDAVESISLANNSIDDVAQVETVATTFPQLKNLDMSGNQISSLQGLDRWKGKFKELETLYMVGNPIENVDANYQAAILDWFPKLQNINGTQLRTPEQIAEKVAAQLPKAIPQKGPDFRDVGGIGEKFLLEFFAGYDNDRATLLSQLYDDGSQFSLAVDTASVRDPNAPAPLPWAPYIKLSRNLMRINSLNARIQRLFKGANMIHELWKGLPFTQHPSIKENMNKYIMDCHPLPGLTDPSGMSPIGVDGLIIAVHGEFEECDQQSKQMGMRSFSRTFVLGPGQPGKGPIRVVSDILSLRAYSPLPDIFARGDQSAPQSTHAVPQDQHQAMILELSKQTGMTPQYSEMCLVQVEWNFDKGLAMFAEKKTQLPPDAFATPQ